MVYLIDSYKLKKFDFEKLKHDFVQEFPTLKRSALILSLQATIRLKVAELCLGICKVAILSAAVAAIPLPGLNVIYDLGLVSKQVRDYYTQLGPDETSLRRYAKLTPTNYHRLRYIVDGRLFFGLQSAQHGRLQGNCQSDRPTAE